MNSCSPAWRLLFICILQLGTSAQATKWDVPKCDRALLNQSYYSIESRMGNRQHFIELLEQEESFVRAIIADIRRRGNSKAAFMSLILIATDGTRVSFRSSVRRTSMSNWLSRLS